MSAPERIYAQVSDWPGGAEYIRATSEAKYHSGYGHKPEPVEYVRADVFVRMEVDRSEAYGHIEELERLNTTLSRVIAKQRLQIERLEDARPTPSWQDGR